MTQERITAAEFRRRVGASTTHENHALRKLPDAKPERDKAAALDGSDEGKTGGIRRTRIRFVGHRVKPLDPDNFAGSVKDLLDGLRHANIIQGDEPWRITLETEQVKVRHYSDEMTVIEIEMPNDQAERP